MLLSRITVWVIPGFILSLYFLIIYLPHVRATVGDVCNNNCTAVVEICNSTGFCECTGEYYDNNGTDPGGTCDPKHELDAACTAVPNVQVCKDNNSECNISAICSCKPDYYDTNGNGPARSCHLKPPLGATCTAVENVQVCKDNNSECNSSGICSCKPDYYDSNGNGPAGTCLLKPPLGATCTAVANVQVCKDNNSECNISGICSCKPDYYDSDGNGPAGTCLLKPVLDATCTAVANVQVCKDNNSECNSSGICSCKPDYYDSNGNGPAGTCLLKPVLDATCSAVANVQVCKDNNSECNSSGICSCKPDYYDSNGNGPAGTCLLKPVLDATCSAVANVQVCKDNNSECNSSGICSCKPDYYDSNGNGPAGTCLLKPVLDATCSAVANVQVCKDNNSECNSSGICSCKPDYYDSNGNGPAGTCLLKPPVGATCTAVANVQVCKDNNSECNSSGICSCKPDYYDSNGNGPAGTCLLKPVLDANCTAVANVQVCKDNNSECNISGKCSCKPDFYDNDGIGSAGICELKVDLGTSCLQPNACKTQNAYCGNSSRNEINVCVCNTNYYDNNGEGAGGECIDVTYLAVKSVIFGIITETSINVSWIAPDNQGGVNFYIVEHATNENFVGGSKQNVGTQTSAVLSGLISGQRYVINITSVNNKTASSLRFTSVIKYQTSKPTKPGALLQTSDINASSGNIMLQWATSAGVQTGYVGSLTNLTSFPYNQSFTTSAPSQTFVGVKNGTVYTFTVQAVSEYFNTNRLYSDIRIETIKTQVQVPNPPRDIVCAEITDRYINLTWKPPENPNGDIHHYIITVHRTFPSETMYNITTPSSDGKLSISNLTAGSFYSFSVYTVNERYQSAAEVKLCQTNSQMADPPEDLTVYNLTSRSGEVTWNKPKTLIEAHYGYSLQITNGNGACIREVLWKCSDCQGGFPQLNSSNCVDTAEQNNITSSSLYGSLSYKALNLLPDIIYTVKVSAITRSGRGFNASDSLQTKEEVPQKPVNVTVNNIQATTADLVWNMSEPRPGNTTYTIILTGIRPAQNRTFFISGFYNQSAVLTTLQEYWNYTVTVVASTSMGNNESNPYQFSTQMAPAGLVSLFSIDRGIGEDAYITAVLSWKLPLVLDRNGPIDKFYVQQNERNKPNISKILTVQSDETYTTNFPVVPEGNYIFMVRAANDRFNGTDNVLPYLAPAGPPVNTIEMKGIHVIPVEKFSSPSQTSFQIEINDAFFMDTKNGATKMKGLICCKECKKANSTTMKPSEINDIKTYTQAQKFNSNQYRLPVPPANLSSGETGSKTRRKRNIDSVTVYQVGIESCANKSDSYFCNGPLNPGTSYSIIAFVCTSGDCTLSNSYGPFITLAAPDNTAFPVGAVAGGIVGGVAAIILIAAIVLLLRRRSKKLGKTRKRVDDDEPTDMANLSKIKKQRPINLANFAEYVADYHKDSNLKFSEEYDDLKALSPSHPHEAADMEENRLKNRFVNILPFDHTRVKLRPIDDVSGSDYINANYLPGFSKTREYIACQGPIPATIDDHWRLIWEQNVRVIVMLTQYKEENRVKCEQYMPLEPKDPKQYGDLVVECMTYSSMNSFEYRTLKIRLGEKERTIKHFHFLSWRDYSANVQLDTMIDFIKKVRSFIQPPDVEGPMIIHCSAGVGRTGTYITIDYAMQLIDKYGPDSTIDIFNFVLKMRENRTTMVQTEQQYIFIHDCIKEYLDRFKTYENQAFNPEEENLYQNTAETMDLYQNVSFNCTQKTEL